LLFTLLLSFSLCFFNHPPTPQIYSLSLHDALPICRSFLIELPYTFYALFIHPKNIMQMWWAFLMHPVRLYLWIAIFIKRTLLKRSEEHTSELQSRENLVCRLLLEKKKR